MLKKVIAIALICMMTLTAVSCTGSPNSTPSQGKGESSTGTQESAGTSEGGPEGELVGNMYVEGLPILKEAETYKIAAVRDALSLKNISEKEAAIQAEAATNVKIDWMEIPQEGWTEKVNVMLSANDLPDAFIGGIDVMKNTRALAPLNDLIDKYAPNVQAMFANRPDVKKALTAPDGNIYSLPSGDDVISNAVSDALYVNKDWLEKLNLKVPTTTDEFYEVLKAFKTQDPNGNGKEDEIPLGISASNYASTMCNLFGSFGTLDTTDYARIENGKVIFTPSEDSYFEALQWMNKLYSEQLMNQDYFTENMEQFLAKGNGAEPLMGFIMSWVPDNVVSPEFAPSYIAVAPLKGPDGTQLWAKSRAPLGAMSDVVITRACKNPEVLVRWYDYNNSSLDTVNLWNFGPEGTGTWKKLDNGKWTIYKDTVPADSNFPQFRRTEGYATHLTYCYSLYTDPSVQEFDERSQLKNQAVELYLPFTPKENFINGLEEPEKAGRKNLLFVDIENYIKTFKADAVMNGITQQQWEQHIKKLKSLKVDEYIQLLQDFYDLTK